MNKILPLFLFAVFALGSFAVRASDGKPYKEITAEQLKEMQKNNDSLVLIDSRGGKYFNGEVIAGAVHLSVKDTNAETLGKIVASKGADIVFYCTNTACQASALSAYKAAYAGYASLYKYSGGIEEWKEKGLPTATVN